MAQIVFYSCTIEYAKSPFATVTITTEGCASLEEAEQLCWQLAARLGTYRKPKWWEFWRWGERRPPTDLPPPAEPR